MTNKKNTQSSENSNKRSSLEFLPKFFRTDTNRKFLTATVDQLISDGAVEKINGFIGRKTASAFTVKDQYIDNNIEQRQPYQLEPAIIYEDKLGNIEYFKDYVDYTNQLKRYNFNFADHSVANSQEFYPWNPHIDWDKIINYREYFWLPNGPQAIAIKGQSIGIVSTYTVELSDEGDNQAYIFSPDGKTRNPSLKLYRGQRYRFEIDCPGHPMAFSTTRSFVPTQSLIIASESGVETGGLYDVQSFDLLSFDTGSWSYTVNTAKVDTGKFNLYDIWTDGVESATVYVEKGIIEFTIPENSPDVMYYVSKNDINTGGLIKIYNIDEATSIDVENEILGKKQYSLEDETELSNGMKVYFIGQVTPTRYQTGNWYVEGVGTTIKLISEDDLIVPGSFSDNRDVEFDNEAFDVQGFDVNYAFPAEKDYIVINRSSQDGNQWSRYNRWFHRSVIEQSAIINDTPIDLDQNQRAKRPIIEFDAGLKLFNFGIRAKKYVDLVDTKTLDVFGSSAVGGVQSGIEGSIGYVVDGENLVAGMRVLFTADPDILVNGRIFKVSTVTHLGIKRLTLIEEDDSLPNEGDTVVPLMGNHAGNMYHFMLGKWVSAQQKTEINQSPLFDVVDSGGISFSDRSKYPGSTFSGTKIISYKSGNTIDSELGIPISYRSIENIGDIIFDFNLHQDNFQYQLSSSVIQKKIDTGYLLKIFDAGLKKVNGWIKSSSTSDQWVINQYNIVDASTNLFPIDVYDNIDLDDLKIKVFLNNIRQTIIDFEIFQRDKKVYLRFFENLDQGDVLLVKTRSKKPKNSQGFYEFPSNLEDNPLNENLSELTLGQMIDHIRSIVENLDNFQGDLFGSNNLRDLGPISNYGKKIVQHSSSLLPVIYHFTNNDYNIISALRFASEEYNKFKKNFIKHAEDLGFDGEVYQHLDLILSEMTKDKDKSMPFYLSDMLGYRANKVFSQTIIDDSIKEYPLSFSFDLTSLSNKSVLVYLNDQQLLHGKEYEFFNDNFVRIFKVQRNDRLKIVQYETTDGCFIPPTPTKLGIYPLYTPEIYVDETYQTPTKVIRGHDGSTIVCYDDFRDHLLLELEKRIYNNTKIKYDRYLTSFLPGAYRTSDVSLENFNAVLLQDFLKWNRSINRDFIKNTFFDYNNPWSYNYNRFLSKGGVELPGSWRGIYNLFYDTDAPHLEPWKMQGFSEKPIWWEDFYGPAPYTKDNQILWNDIAQGLIRDSKFPRYDNNFARPTILDHLPVNSSGDLLNPLEAGLIDNFYNEYIDADFEFGDQGPIETAWRRSSQYPFAIIIALTILKPAEMFAKIFDKSRQVYSEDDQLIYRTKSGDFRFSNLNVEYPSTVQDSSENSIFCSGLINYITEFIINKSLSAVNDYREKFSNLSVKLSSKLEGFVSKEKFKLILDSRTPINEGNVFVPNENYRIILNTSSPIERISYSGVVIERTMFGYSVNGYDLNVSEFDYFKPITIALDPVLNIGGISEPYVTWAADRYYAKGSIVRYDNGFYRTTIEHRSSQVFELKYFDKLESLPISGGRSFILRSKFESSPTRLSYGTNLKSVQEVVDFLLGYGKYLEHIGFVFETFNERLQTIMDWSLSAREFAYWTTQNWNINSAISLSPAALNVEFFKDFVVVNDIINGPDEYNVLKQDGNVLDTNFISSNRDGNKFNLIPVNTSDGIYFISLDLVSKEHVLVIDDVTIFNDIIYDRKTGYRQDRIKVVGYKTFDWNGSFSIPGFIYDEVTPLDWKPWVDYSIGDTVRFKEFYYSARVNVPGAIEFDPTQWIRQVNKPTSRLLPNWEYRANQFADFYSLDSDNFDVNQQKFAQHLIGYQNRRYLANIINDDVSQYKFYQGMIREKGTKNSLNKMFDALNFSQKDSIEFHEQWAIRLGQYGASEAFDELEYNLDEKNFKIDVQPIELVNELDPYDNDIVYRILPDQIYIKPEGYNHKPFLTMNSNSTVLDSAGYVVREDVNFSLVTYEDIKDLAVDQIREGDYAWIAYDTASWQVRRFTTFNQTIVSMEIDSDRNIKVVYNGLTDAGIVANEYILIKTTNTDLVGFRKILKVTPESFTIQNSKNITQERLNNIFLKKSLVFNKIIPWRLASFDNQIIRTIKHKPNELVWIDNAGSDAGWKVWKFSPSYSRRDLKETERRFARNFVVSKDNLTLVTANFNRLLYYTRPTEKSDWVSVDQISPFIDIPFRRSLGSQSFGDSMDISDDGKRLLVGAPRAKNISGDSTNSEGEGFAVLYEKNNNNIYFSLKTTYTSVNRAPGEQFGYRVAYSNDGYAIIASKGQALWSSNKDYSINDVVCDEIDGQWQGFIAVNNHRSSSVNNTSVTTLWSPVEYAPAAIYKFSLASNNIISKKTFQEAQIIDMDTAGNRIVVSLTDNKVFVLDLSLNETQLMLLPSQQFNNAEFGKSLSLDHTAEYLAIGAPNFSGSGSQDGAVAIYQINDDDGFYDLSQILAATTDSENFGSKLKFFASDQLVVFGAGGRQTFETTFDLGRTTFDANNTKIIDESEFTGTVKLFDRYEEKFIYSCDIETLIVDQNEIKKLGPNYGSQIKVVNNHVYINDPLEFSGILYEFESFGKAWQIYRKSAPIVDLSKIKSVSLYNTETSEIIEKLDFIDPLRGKIAGVADQEITYKVPYDPATYSYSDNFMLSLDEDMSWGKNHVGELWWDTSSTRFIEANQGSVLYKSNTWNSIFSGTSVRVCEWVESSYLPSQWDLLANSDDGESLNITGRSLYGDAAYTLKKRYDNVSKVFKNIYYYWVVRPTTTPSVKNRKLSASDVARYIEDPSSMKLKFITFLGTNQFNLVNCRNLFIGNKINLNIQIWTIRNTEVNIHSHYQILSETDDLNDLNSFIEKKWIDSLIGYDQFGNIVPDNQLPEKLKYGILNRPRQSMFVNRIEALKQFVERANSIFEKNLLVDDFQLSKLYSREEPPTIDSGEFDVVVNTSSELRFETVFGFKKVKAQPVIEQGKIVRVIINDPGQKYVTAPVIIVVGSGNGAELKATINVKGQVTAIDVIRSGQEYNSDTAIVSRGFSALVINDETSSRKWSLYELGENLTWFKKRTQTFDTTLYWKYKDWYAEGYNQYTKIDHIVDFSYQIFFEDIKLGETVKVNNQGSGGWLLLEKTSDSDSLNLNINFKTIGRKDGTIKLDSNLYKFKNSRIGFDGPIFDSEGYDEQPKEELRIILDVIKNNILVDQLKPRYKELFFSSLRYVFTEQKLVDWAFKTAFIVGKHNLGELDQPINFKNNNLNSYREYIEEVKPYSTKIKEFVTAYEKIEKTNSKVSDFDLPPVYSTTSKKIEVVRTSVQSGLVIYDDPMLDREPYTDWANNLGFSIDRIEVTDPGEGYLTPPVINIQGIADVPARARAYLSEGKLFRIEIEEPGSGYASTPQIEIIGAFNDRGRSARAFPILGKPLTRTNSMEIKFDRTAPKYFISNLNVSENFIGTGSKRVFDLKWPIDLRIDKTIIKIAQEELLPTDYLLENISDANSSYSRLFGRIMFDQAPENFSSITVQYRKNISLLNASDRIQHYYKPNSGMIGKDLGQLMEGVDYGGVEIRGLTFDIGSGWDALPWSISGWDNFDRDFTDFVVKSDGSTRSWTLPYIPAAGEIINIYLNGVRIDDINFNANNPLSVQLAEQLLDLDQIKNDILIGNSQLTALNLTIQTSTQQLINLNAQLVIIAARLFADPTNQTLIDQQQSLQALYNSTNNQLTSAIFQANITTSLISNLEVDRISLENDILITRQQLDQAPKLSNPFAIMNSFVGNGNSQAVITLPADAPFLGDFTPNDLIDTIIFRKSTSDGSFKPDDKTFDVELTGGDFSYNTARGLRPEEIILDGDDFVTPTTSRAPEEVIPGQVMDTIDISVYDRIYDKKPFILFESYYLDGSTRKYLIGQFLQNQSSVFLKVSNQILTQNVDYKVDYIDNSVELLLSTLPSNEILTVVSFGKNAFSLLDIDTVRSTGNKNEFVTLAKSREDFSIFVTIDGKDAGFITFVSDEGYIGIRFAENPPRDALIEYIITSEIENSISKMQKYTVTSNGSLLEYVIPNVPAVSGPLETNIIVNVNGKIKTPNRTFYFRASPPARSFFIDSVDFPLNNLLITDIEVYQNGSLKTLGVDYDWEPQNNELRFRQAVLQPNDFIAMVVLNTGDYKINKTDSIVSIRLKTSPLSGEIITITTFSNHDILSIERDYKVIKSVTTSSPESPRYFRFNKLRNGIIDLTKPAKNIFSVWVIDDGDWLLPYRDYILDDDGKSIKINPDRITKDVGFFDIIVFDTNPSDTTFGYKIFKDLLNRISYIRIDDRRTTLLTKPLKKYDTSIEVFDSTGLLEPDTNNQIPGVILVDGERIEYLEKSGNSLRKIRRGTLGTGIANEYPIDTLVKDFSVQQLIPYKDEFVTNVMVISNQSRIIPLNFVPNVTAASLIGDSWTRKTIPDNFGQCDEIEVFVAGRRLRKMPIRKWDTDLGQDSINGDDTLEAEFSVDGISQSVRLTELPEIGQKIVVQKRIGKMWSPKGIALRDSDDISALFIKQTRADSLGTTVDKYKEIKDVINVNTLLLEDGSGPLTDESGNPLEIK